jgi:hypothetical protein
MQLPKFIEEYAMPRTVAMRKIQRAFDPLPAVKIGKLWYVKLDEYPDWEEREHQRSYKYARGAK